MFRLENFASPLFLFQKIRLSENDFHSPLTQKIRYQADEKFAAKFPYDAKKNFSEKKFQLILVRAISDPDELLCVYNFSHPVLPCRYRLSRKKLRLLPATEKTKFF